MIRSFSVACAAFVALLPLQVSARQEAPREASHAERQAQASQEGVPVFPTSAFAARAQLSGAQLSPDGSRLASRSNHEGIDFVLLFDAATGQPAGRIPLNKGDRLVWLRWAGNQKILLSAAALDKYNRYFTRLFAIDLKERRAFSVGEKNGVRDQDDVVFIADDGSFALVSHQRRPSQSPSVFKYELAEDGKREEVQGPRKGVWDWYADHDGVIRIGTGVRVRELRIHYRSGPDENLELVQRLKFERLRKPNGDYRYFEILGIEPGTDIGYVLEENEGGKVGLRSYDFAQSQVVNTIYEHDIHDVESVGFSRDGRPIWVSYTVDRSEIVWLDEEMATLQSGLEEALDEEQVRIVSRTHDNGRMIIHAGGRGDPGALYLFDAQAMSLDALGELKPGLDFQHLAKTQAVEYQARDGTSIRAYLTLPVGRPPRDLPLIVMPHGGPYGVRDTLRYDDWVQLLVNRGYAVIQPNYRGSGGYGEEFLDLGIGQIGRAMQDDLDDATDWLVDQGIADPGRVCLVGASYGGYAALWGVTRNPERYRCAASWAGVTDWDSMLRYDSQFLSRGSSRRWRDRVRGSDDFNLEAVSPLKQANNIRRPVLLAHGTDDGIVNVGQYHLLRRALESRNAMVSTLLIEGEGHSFYDEANEQKWFDRLVAFLEEHNPAAE